MNFKFYFLLPVIFTTVFVSSVFADDQVPGMVVAVEGDPYYFSEGGFGFQILKYFNRSLEPYLVSGETTEQSSLQEISQAYNIATEHITQKVIVQDIDRATLFVVHFSGGDIKETQTYSTFSKFTHTEEVGRSETSPSYKIFTNGLELESLPSTDKQWFYYNVISHYINPGKEPQPFDVTIDIVTGDNHILQTWKYGECEVIEYLPFLDENLVILKFVGDFISEIREKTAFGCDEFKVDFELKIPSEIPSSTLKLGNFVPDKTERAEQILVQFSGGELEFEKTFYSFSKFAPLTQKGTFPILTMGNPFGTAPRFTLESLPSKDNAEFYQFISRYVNIGSEPEPFDVTIHLVTGDGSILQTWKYTKCSGTNYVTFFLDNLIFYKFKQTFGSEIRDKVYFECVGLKFNPEELGKKNVETTGISIPDDNQRAQTFVAHFQGPDIAPQKTITSFTKFSPITNEELPILLPTSPLGEQPRFYFESLPNKENVFKKRLVLYYLTFAIIPYLYCCTITR